MPSLSEMQAAFRQAVLEERPDALAAMIDPRGLAARVRIAVYRDNVLGALAAALRQAYPSVLALVGAAFFDQAAALYARYDPPGSARLADWGAGFADCLRTHPGCAGLPWLHEVARLDRAVEQALQAPAAPVLRLADLSRLPADTLAGVVLRPQPSLALLRPDSPADAIRRCALAGGEGLKQLDPAAGPVHLAVLRCGESIAIRRLEAPAWGVLDALAGGRPLGIAAAEAGPDAFGRMLAEFLAQGCFAARDPFTDDQENPG